MPFRACKILLYVSALFPPLCSFAQELSPRAYWPAPVGARVATVGYTHTSGDIVPDRSLPVTNVDSTINSMHLGYRHTLSLWNRTANLTLEIPYSSGDTIGRRDDDSYLMQEYSGPGDLAVTMSVNILGAKAMNKLEFNEMRRNTPNILGASLKFVAPTGEYDSAKLINIGANRWAMKAEIGYITPLRPKWLLETSLGVWVFDDNENLLGFNKEQDPVVNVQGHLIHRFKPGFWASLDINYYEGGRSTIGGVRLDNLQRDSKIGATMVFPFATRYAVKLGYSHGSLNDSGQSFQSFLISFQQLL